MLQCGNSNLNFKLRPWIRGNPNVLTYWHMQRLHRHVNRCQQLRWPAMKVVKCWFMSCYLFLVIDNTDYKHRWLSQMKEETLLWRVTVWYNYWAIFYVLR